PKEAIAPEPTPADPAPAKPSRSTSEQSRQSILPLEGDLFAPRPEEPEVTAPHVEMQGAQIGTKLRLEKLEKGGGKLEVTLVSERDHDPENAKIGIHTPLGEALLDKEVGETAEYTTGPYVKEVKILDLTRR